MAWRAKAFDGSGRDSHARVGPIGLEPMCLLRGGAFVFEAGPLSLRRGLRVTARVRLLQTQVPPRVRGRQQGAAKVSAQSVRKAVLLLRLCALLQGSSEGSV